MFERAKKIYGQLMCLLGRHKGHVDIEGGRRFWFRCAREGCVYEKEITP